MKYLYLALIFLANASCKSRQEKASGLQGSIIDSGRKSYNIESLREILSTKAVKSIDQLLPLLPESLRGHYAAFYKSSSEQGSSFESPRIILYGDDARFIVAFNGDPTHENFHCLEVIQFNDKKKAFEFFAVSFPEGGENRHGTDACPIIASGDLPKISQKNPSECKSCHTKDLRPNWDVYSLWPGAYGSDDDSVYSQSLEISKREVNQLEVDGLKVFLRGVDAKPRYRHLDNPLQYFAEKPKLGVYAGGGADSRMNGRPNENFGMALQNLNSERIWEKLKMAKDYEKRKFFFAGVIRECGRFLADFGQPELYNATLPAFDNIYDFKKSPDKVHSRVRAFANSKYKGIFDTNFFALDYLDYAVGAGIGFDLRQISLIPQSRNYLYVEGKEEPSRRKGMEGYGKSTGLFVTGANNEPDMVLSSVFKNDPDFAEANAYVKWNSEKNGVSYPSFEYERFKNDKQKNLCEWLAEKSRAASL